MDPKERKTRRQAPFPHLNGRQPRSSGSGRGSRRSRPVSLLAPVPLLNVLDGHLTGHQGGVSSHRDVASRHAVEAAGREGTGRGACVLDCMKGMYAVEAAGREGTKGGGSDDPLLCSSLAEHQV